MENPFDVPCPVCQERVSPRWMVRSPEGEEVLLCWNGHRFRPDGSAIEDEAAGAAEA